jgi:hypothetical protein
MVGHVGRLVRPYDLIYRHAPFNPLPAIKLDERAAEAEPILGTAVEPI